jgi:hypothetical protein
MIEERLFIGSLWNKMAGLYGTGLNFCMSAIAGEAGIRLKLPTINHDGVP